MQSARRWRRAKQYDREAQLPDCIIINKRQKPFGVHSHMQSPSSA